MGTAFEEAAKFVKEFNNDHVEALGLEEGDKLVIRKSGLVVDQDISEVFFHIEVVNTRTGRMCTLQFVWGDGANFPFWFPDNEEQVRGTARLIDQTEEEVRRRIQNM